MTENRNSRHKMSHALLSRFTKKYKGLLNRHISCHVFAWDALMMWAIASSNMCMVICIVSSPGLVAGTVCTVTCVNAWLDCSPGVQSAEHNHHQLLRPLSEGGARRRPGDGQTRGRVRLRLQQRPSSAHLQQHKLCLLPQPLPGAPQSIRRSGAETWCSDYTQSTSSDLLLLLWFLSIISLQ